MNGTNGTGCSISYLLNESTPFTFFKSGIDDNFIDEMYKSQDIPMYCFTPHEDSLLYHHGAEVHEMLRDFYNYTRNKDIQTVDFIEQDKICTNEGTMILMLFIITIVLFFI